MLTLILTVGRCEIRAIVPVHLSKVFPWRVVFKNSDERPLRPTKIKNVRLVYDASRSRSQSKWCYNSNTEVFASFEPSEHNLLVNILLPHGPPSPAQYNWH